MTRPGRIAWGQALLWGAFLACSWTWCIGMFLPVLLVRDFGTLGFVVFAVPNVLGAGVMGWVMARPLESHAFVRRHLLACRAFTIVTIAFQVSFLAWFMDMLHIGSQPGATLVMLALGIGLVAAVMSPTRLDPWLACGVLVFSVCVFVRVLTGDHATVLPRTSLMSPGSLPTTHILWLAPVCIFGFALCPYLDLTFHRARQSAHSATGTAAFTLGFGVFFLAMILLTLAYAPMFIGRDGHIARLPAMLIAAHIGVQALFTIHLHARHVPTPGSIQSWRGRVALIAGVGFVAIAGFAPHVTARLNVVHGLSPAEAVYRGMMVFYGLIFPAYVWLCAIPTRDGHSGLGGRAGRRKGLILILAVSLALPAYWLGFLARETPWLGLGLGVILFARLALPQRTAVTDTPEAHS